MEDSRGHVDLPPGWFAADAGPRKRERTKERGDGAHGGGPDVKRARAEGAERGLIETLQEENTSLKNRVRLLQQKAKDIARLNETEIELLQRKLEDVRVLQRKVDDVKRLGNTELELVQGELKALRKSEAQLRKSEHGLRQENRMLKSKLQKDSQDHRSYQRSVNDAFGKAVEDSLKKKMDEQMLPFIQAYEHLKRENGMLRASNERYKEILRKQPGRWTDEVEVKQERLENVENDSYINLPAYLHGGKNPGQANGPEFEVNEAMANVNQQPGSAKAPGTRRSKRAKRSPPPSASGSLPNGNSFPAAVAPQNPQIKSENGVATGPVEPQPSVQGGVGSDGAARQVLTGAWSYAEAQQAAGFGATAAPPADIPAWGAGSAAAPDSPVQWGSRSGSSPRGRGEGGTPAFEWGPGSVASPEIDWSQAGRASLQTDE